jgi:hypothetical protein
MIGSAQSPLSRTFLISFLPFFPTINSFAFLSSVRYFYCINPQSSFQRKMDTRPFAQTFAELTTPHKIQEFLETLEYSDEERYRCPLNVLKDRKAHCFDGALFGAAALRNLGYPPLLVEILPNEHDDDHILAVFRCKKYWGTVAKSNFVGLRFREPVYKTLRELIMSYFESYFNVEGERTMIGYTAPLNLKRFDKMNWLAVDEVMDTIGDALETGRKFPIVPPSIMRNFTKVDARSVQAGLMGAKTSGLYKPKQ